MSLLAAGIAGAAALGSAAVGAVSTGKMNKRAVNYAREAWEKQGQRDIQYYNMQNAYNDPSAQMQRLKDAGLNPNLVYGSGDVANTTKAPTAGNAPVPDLKAIDLSGAAGIVGNALSAQQAQANIARTNAETRAIDAKTAGTEFQNAVNNQIGIDKMYERYSMDSEKLQTGNLRQLAEYNAWSAAAFAGKATDDPNSPLAKAQKAGLGLAVQQLENARKTGQAIDFQNVVKQFEANLAKQGISPNTPWWGKLVGDLILKGLGVSSFTEVLKNIN